MLIKPDFKPILECRNTFARLVLKIRTKERPRVHKYEMYCSAINEYLPHLLFIMVYICTVLGAGVVLTVLGIYTLSQVGWSQRSTIIIIE